MSTIDYNVDNYTITELFAILDLDDPNSDEIMATTNKYISQFSPSGENQPQLVNFFQSIQTKLTSSIKVKKKCLICILHNQYHEIIHPTNLPQNTFYSTKHYMSRTFKKFGIIINELLIYVQL